MGIFPLFRSYFPWDQPQVCLENLKQSLQNLFSKEIDPQLGASITPKVITNEGYEEAKQFRGEKFYDPLQENIDYLDQIVQICHNQEIQLVLATSPILNILPRMYRFYAPVDVEQISKEFDLAHISFDDMLFTQLHFANVDHLNSFGSVIVTTRFAQKISEMSGIPVNEQALAYYETYFFEKYEITRVSDQVRLTLLPVHKDEGLLYAWKVIKDESILQETSFGSRNQFTFTAHDSGEYIVQVKVWNPEGDFILEGEFSHVVE